MTLKRMAVGAAALLAAGAAPAKSQPTADALLARHIETLGGQQAIAALGSVEFGGGLRFPGDLKLAFERAHAKQDTVSRSEAALQNVTFIEGLRFTGTLSRLTGRGEKD